ncbi:hypothetical protein BDV93DRAFT_515988 [Ceratobasidium sp. AG-I]|nr:hypothetical protein BDV93DRAFT_515988 [Ceratobasidium sp. AG-I]
MRSSNPGSWIDDETYQSCLSSPRPDSRMPLSPTPQALRARPYFSPSMSRASTPIDTRCVSNVAPSNESRKRKATNTSAETKPIAKKSRTDDSISISDDESEYGIKLYNTGYQLNQNGSLIPDSSNVSDSTSTFAGWTGAEGGPIKFVAKPINYDEHALSRWSYSEDGPDFSSVDERTEGDVHFAPAMLKSGSEVFSYWVCVWSARGARWMRFNCGQQHPKYSGFPPHWVKESSFKSSRS